MAKQEESTRQTEEANKGTGAASGAKSSGATLGKQK